MAQGGCWVCGAEELWRWLSGDVVNGYPDGGWWDCGEEGGTVEGFVRVLAQGRIVHLKRYLILCVRVRSDERVVLVEDR